MLVDLPGYPRRADVGRLQVENEHLGLLRPSQRDRLRAAAGDADEMNSRLLHDQIDKRVHELWMVAHEDNPFFSNNSSLVPCVMAPRKAIGMAGATSSYLRMEFFYLDGVAIRRTIGRRTTGLRRTRAKPGRGPCWRARTVRSPTAGAGARTAHARLSWLHPVS